jgi:hypothetical protein
VDVSQRCRRLSPSPTSLQSSCVGLQPQGLYAVGDIVMTALNVDREITLRFSYRTINTLFYRRNGGNMSYNRIREKDVVLFSIVSTAF